MTVPNSDLSNVSASVQARIMDLEDAVHESINTIEFLHGCLTNERFEYAYPEMTEDELLRLRALVPERLYCVHSRQVKGCASCEQRLERAYRRSALDERQASSGD